ncbi:MAG TPA: M28 family peptidase [Longimicrobiaceae bacterium]|nr:M28 family peptidase [Longimicrobiaceae bacterium]
MTPSFARPVLSLLVLLSVGCADAGGDAAREPVGSAVDRPPFPGDEAFTLLQKQVAFGPRIPGTEGHSQQLEWMRDYLAQRADTLIVQPFAVELSTGDTLQLTNLFARFNPDASARVLLVAHWDTRPKADQADNPADRELPVPGANDGASGTAVLMQLAEMFSKQAPPIGVDLLFVDGEDYGPTTDDMLLGAKHFAANLPAGYRPLYGVLLDLIGDKNPRFPVEGYSARYAPEVVQRVWSVARDLGYGNVFVPSETIAITDDHVPLNRAGIHTANVIDFEYGPGNRYWHTPDDVPANTSASSLDMVGEVMAELIYRGG